MGRHIVSRDERGMLGMRQVDEVRPEVRPDPTPLSRGDTNGEQPDPAFAELMAELFDRNTVWAKSRIVRITDLELLKRARAYEITNKRVPGGRPAVLQAIDEQALDIQVRNEVKAERGEAIETSAGVEPEAELEPVGT